MNQTWTPSHGARVGSMSDAPDQRAAILGAGCVGIGAEAVGAAMGIEEEFLLVDQEQLLPATPTAGQTRVLQEITSGGGTTSQEWLSCQVEHATAVLADAAAATTALSGFRRELASTAQRLGMLATPLGAAPDIGAGSAAISEIPRYQQMTELAPAIAAEQYINGMHVHVSIPDPETGIRALNGIRRWLPLLTALGANSPFWRGRDSGFASWRSVHYRRWMVNGAPPVFSDFADYQRRIGALVNSDVVADQGGVCWLARLSQNHPTLEVRACDVQLGTREAVVLACFIRALVGAGIATSADPQPAPELLDVAHWQAAKFGLEARLLDPWTGASAPASKVVRQALSHAWPQLVKFGDAEFVHAGLERILREGTGSSHQRRLARHCGLAGLLRGSAEAIAHLDPARPPELPGDGNPGVGLLPVAAAP